MNLPLAVAYAFIAGIICSVISKGMIQASMAPIRRKASKNI